MTKGVRVGVAIAALLLGLQGTTWAAGPQKVRLWLSDTYRIEGIKPLLAEFNATHPNIQVELEAKDANASNLLPAVAGGVAPNVIVGSSSRDRDFFDSGILADLAPYVKRDNFSLTDYYPATLEFGETATGRLFSLPFDSQIISLYYNADLLGQGGLSAPQAGWTNSDFKAAATKVRRLDADGNITVHGIIGRHPNHVGMFFMGEYKGYLVSLEGGIHSTVRSPQFRSAYETIGDLIRENLLRTQGVDAGISMDLFVNDKAGFYFDGNFRLLDLTKTMPAVRTAPLLRPDTSTAPGAYLWTRTLAMVKSSDDAVNEAAWEVIKFLSSPDALARYTAGARLLPVRPSSISNPAFRSYLAEFGANLDVMASQYLVAGSGLTEMAAPKADAIRGPWQKLSVPYMQGKLPLGEFIEQLATSVDAAVAEARAAETP